MYIAYNMYITIATHIFRRRAKRVDSWWNRQNQKILYNYNRLGMRGGFGNSIFRNLRYNIIYSIWSTIEILLNIYYYNL